MSNWTHVAGIVRIDNIVGSTDFSEKTIRDIIGKELRFDDTPEVWDDAYEYPGDYLPLGSEGSLYATIWKNPNKGSLDAYTVSIFGDLRDHDSAIDVVKWFKNKVVILDCVSFGIRNACVTARNETNGVTNWTYDDNTESAFFNDNHECAVIISDDIGVTMCINGGDTMEFDDYNSAIAELELYNFLVE